MILVRDDTSGREGCLWEIDGGEGAALGRTIALVRMVRRDIKKEEGFW